MRMETHPTNDPRRAYRLVIGFWSVATLGPLPIYIAINVFLRRHMSSAAMSSFKPEYAYLVLLALTALTAPLIKPVGRLLSSEGITTSFSVAGGLFARLSPGQRKLFGAVGVMASMAHMLSVLGFIFAMLTGKPSCLYLGILLTLALMLLHLPWYERWKEILRN